MDFCKLQNLIQEYDWGSPEFIPELLGVDNTNNTPKAEMWMGVHPKAPSLVIEATGTTPLPDLIMKNPGGMLGSAVAEQFADKLPFLFKVLAAETALSIQSHPNLEQARSGYTAENERGIPLDASNRNYRDPNHKPEIICALTPFWAMCGFRPIDEIVRNLTFSGARFLEQPLAILMETNDRAALKVFFSFLLRLSRERKAELIDRACDVAAKDVKEAKDARDDKFEWVLELNRQFPGDIGVICPLLLNLYHLKPGQAIYLGAGELHAYLQGLGIELMANSDNVLRGGLTKKHVDLKELLGTLTFHPAVVPVIEGRELKTGETVYDTQAAEFLLGRIEVYPGAPFRAEAARTIEILIVTEGSCTIGCDGEVIQVAKGESMVVPASACRYEISGNAVLYRASVP